MGTIYYIFDDNGKIYSENKTRRFTALEGMRLHDYMKTEASRKAYFLKTEDEKGNLIAIQMPEEMVEEYEKERWHAKYLREFEKQYQHVSLDMSTGEDDGDTLESFIAEEDEDLIADVCKKGDIDYLRMELKQLTENQLTVITMMYLGRSVLSEREVAVKMGVSSIAIHKTKQSAMKKLKKFLNS